MLPVPMPLQDAIANVKPGTSAARFLQEAAMMIWDEAPTEPRSMFEAADACLRDLRRQNKPFGGLTVVCGGRFPQIAPILPRVPPEMTSAYCLCSLPWYQDTTMAKRHSLVKNMRALNDADFAHFLLEVGNATTRTEPLKDGTTLPANMVRLPDYITVPEAWTASDLCEWVFQGFQNQQLDALPEFYDARALLVPTNEEACALNVYMNAKLCTETERISWSVATAETALQDGQIYTDEFLHTLEPSGMSPHELPLRIGSLHVLLRNYNPSEGLCNGTSLIAHGLHAK